MKEQSGLWAVAAAIALSVLIFTVTHRYQYFPQVQTGTINNPRVFDTWTGRSAVDPNF